MITAVDTNIFLSVLVGPEEEALEAERALWRTREEGTLTISVICFAELARRFRTQDQLMEFLTSFSCEVHLLDEQTAFLAGRYYDAYLERGGTRKRILADFLVAADAKLYADRILTNDEIFFKTNFPGLLAFGSRPE